MIGIWLDAVSPGNLGRIQLFGPGHYGAQITGADLPAPGATARGGVQSQDCSGAGHVLKINTDGSVTCSADAAGQLYTSTAAANITPSSTTDTVIFSTGTLPALASGGSPNSCFKVTAYIHQLSPSGGLSDLKLWYGTAPGTAGSYVESTFNSTTYNGGIPLLAINGRICNQYGSTSAQHILMQIAGWNFNASNYGTSGLYGAASQTSTGTNLKIGVTLKSATGAQSVAPVSFEVDYVH